MAKARTAFISGTMGENTQAESTLAECWKYLLSNALACVYAYAI